MITHQEKYERSMLKQYHAAIDSAERHELFYEEVAQHIDAARDVLSTIDLDDHDACSRSVASIIRALEDAISTIKLMSGRE